MKNNYRKLGDYIQPVDVRNSDLKVSHLLGVSVEKRFIESIANTIGTDFSKYKIVRRGQFTYIPDTSRRGDKIGIALLTEFDEGLVSNIYTVFEITDTTKLLPEYLMLWFSRPEFDRYSRYKSHGSVREIFDWDEMCRVELPVPDLKEQEKIVNTYNAITKRIQLKQKINENLEKTAQTIYRKMFVEDADKNWKIGKLSDYCKFQEGYVNPPQEYPEYFDGMIKWLRAVDINESYVLNTSRTLTDLGFKSAGTSALLFKPNTIAITKSGTIGRLAIISDFMCGNRAIINIEPNEKLYLPFIHQYLKSRQKEFLDMSVGSVQKNLYVSILAELPIIKPELSSVEEYYKTVECLYEQKLYNCKEISKLQELKQLVISRISGM